MKFSLLGLGAAIVGTCHAEVLMASTSSGEHLELHGVMGPFHPPHHVAHPPIMQQQEQEQQGLNPVVKYAHVQCQTDMHHLCASTSTSSTTSTSTSSSGGNVVVVVPRRTRVPLEDPLLAELLYHASQEKEFPLMRMAFPLEQHQSSLDLLDELTTTTKKTVVPSPVMKRMRVNMGRGVVPDNVDDTMDQLVEEMLQHSIAFTKTAKIEPTKEEEEDDGSLLLATTKEDLKENIAEQTLGVLVNSLLDHATSASASASSDTTATEDEEEESFPYDPTFVSKKISLYGKKILDDSNKQHDDENNNNKDEDEDLRQRLARRLTEVTPFHGMPPCKKRRTFVLSQPMVPVPPAKPLLHLPLPVEMCLWDAKKRHILSLSCEMALNKVLVTPNVDKYYDNNIDLYPIPLKRSSQRRWSPFMHRPPCHQRRKAIFHFLFNFVFAFTMFYIIYYGYEKTQSKKKRFHKVKKIMNAIHNDPALKAAVEQSMGQSIQQSQQQQQSQQESSSCLSLCDTLFDMLPVFGLVLLLMHVAAYSPNFVIMIGAPILGLTSCYTFVRSIACDSSSSSSTDDQDDDDEEELITDNYTLLPQENYNNNNNNKKAQTHLYEGVPVQVV